MPTATQLRNGLIGLSVLATNDLDKVWRKVTTAELARDALIELLPLLVQVYGSAAAALAADWYDDRRTEAGAEGSFTAVPVEVDDAGTDELTRWSVSPLFQSEPDWDAARTLVIGGLQRRVTNAGRFTVVESSLADPGALGWQRVGAGSCAFCQMLISRGAVYTEATASFASHDHCRCAAVPAFGGEQLPVKPYTPAQRKGTDADRARVREYLRNH